MLEAPAVGLEALSVFGPIWVRMLAYPGGAVIEGLDAMTVAVDVQVRKVTEYLGVTDTSALELDDARPRIQSAWATDVSKHGGGRATGN